MFLVTRFLRLIGLDKVAARVEAEPAMKVTELSVKFASKFEPRASEVVSAEIANLEGLKGKFLGIELLTAQRAESCIASLKQELARVPHDQKYPRFDLPQVVAKEQWNAAAGNFTPSFAVFSVKNPQCHVRVSATLRNKSAQVEQGRNGRPEQSVKFDVSSGMAVTANLGNGLRAKVHQAFQDQLNAMNPRPQDVDFETGLAANFAVTVPDEVRAVVVSALPGFEEMYIVTAAPDWTLAPSGVAYPVKPGAALLVGRAFGQHWLLAEFQTEVAPV